MMLKGMNMLNDDYHEGLRIELHEEPFGAQPGHRMNASQVSALGPV